MLYWSVGNRIRTAILQEKRAEYGKEIVSTLSRQLTAEHGRGFSQKVWLCLKEGRTEDKVLRPPVVAMGSIPHIYQHEGPHWATP
jgi:hypothetical protein